MTTIGKHTDFTTTDLERRHTLRGRTTDENGNRLIYAQASGAISQYDFVGIDESGQAAKLTKAIADDGHTIAAAQVAFADDDYGWFVTSGVFEGNVGSACAQDAPLFTSGTSGTLDDTSTSQTEIVGAYPTEADGGSGGNVTILASVDMHIGKTT